MGELVDSISGFLGVARADGAAPVSIAALQKGRRDRGTLINVRSSLRPGHGTVRTPRVKFPGGERDSWVGGRAGGSPIVGRVFRGRG